MASHAPAYRSAPLDVLLASVPSLPRPILARLTARMIERLDELDGDAGSAHMRFRYVAYRSGTRCDVLKGE